MPIYVSPTGDDNLNLGTFASPFATPQRALDELGPFGRDAIRCAPGTYPSPTMRGIQGPILFEGSDPTELVAPQPVLSGTDAENLAGTGFTADAHIEDRIQILSGVATGHERTILANGTASLTPVRKFDPVPEPGDLFRIITSSVKFTGIGPAPFATGCGNRWGHLSNYPVPFHPDHVQSGLFFRNIDLEGVDSSARMLVIDSEVHFFGVGLNSIDQIRLKHSDLICGTDTLYTGEAGRISALLGLPSTALAGCTLSARSTRFSVGGGSLLHGYLIGTGSTSVTDNSVLFMTGGYLQKWVQGVNGAEVSISSVETPLSKIYRNGSWALSGVYTGTRLYVGSGCEIKSEGAGQSAIRCERHAGAEISGTAIVTADGYAVDATGGGIIYANGDPDGNWTGGTADLKANSDTASSSFLSTIGATLASSSGDGSRIFRRL